MYFYFKEILLYDFLNYTFSKNKIYILQKYHSLLFVCRRLLLYSSHIK